MAREDFDRIAKIEHGLALSGLRTLRERGLTAAEIGEIVIAPRTVKHRRSRREPLSDQESDRLVRVTNILDDAEALFGEPAKALRWLRRRDDRLRGRTRLSLLRTEAGGRLVSTMLAQIREGIYT